MNLNSPLANAAGRFEPKCMVKLRIPAGLRADAFLGMPRPMVEPGWAQGGSLKPNMEEKRIVE